MTFGTINIPGGYPDNTMSYYRTWNGQNGKKENVNGRVREKWNNFTMTKIYQSPVSGNTNPIGMSTPLLNWTAADELNIQSQLVERIKGHQFNLAVNLAQSNQLADMCVLNIKKFGRSLVYLKRGDFSSAARQLGIKARKSKLDSKDISGRWLELQYGWLPSISDTFEAAKAFESITKMRSTRVSAFGKRVVLRNDLGAAPSLYRCVGRQEVKKSIVYEMEESISLPRSLGVYDPLSLVWEILPYSFVIDWFLPIGSYLENLSVIPFLRGRFRSTTISSTTCVYSHKIASNYGCNGRTSYFIQLDRVVTSGLNTQRPSFNSIPMALSAKRIFNAAALVHQRLL
jgi:hypothetical protein